MRPQPISALPAPAILTALVLTSSLGVSSCGSTPPTVSPTVVVRAACPAGRGDCDADAGNGCESDLSQPTSCGRCGVVCAVGEACAEGECRRAHRLQAGVGACAVRGGAVHCWGPQAGIPDTVEETGAHTLPRRLLDLKDAMSVRFNASMSLPVCAVRRNGTIACWDETPAALGALTGVRDVATYSGDACAVSTGGQLRCGSSDEKLELMRDISDALAVTASDDGMFVLRRSGRVAHLAFGSSALEELPGIDDAVDLATADHTLCVLRKSGKVACAAAGYPPSATFLRPAQRKLLDVPGLADAVALDTECAVRASGEAVEWTLPGTEARPIPGVKDARQIACGWGFGCYERADAAVLCWGSRRSGRLGDGGSTTHFSPVVVEGITDARAVVVGPGSCVLRHDGSVWCWGGQSPTRKRAVPPERVPGIEGATSLTGVHRFACAAGPGKPITCFEPRLPLGVQATFEGLGNVTKAIGFWNGPGVALRPSGEVVLFDSSGGAGTRHPASVVLAGVRDAVDIAQTSRDVCVLRKSGVVACAPTLDLFEKTPPTSPKLIDVSGLRDATMLSGALAEICAVRRSGATACIREARVAAAKGKGKSKLPGPAYVTAESRYGDVVGVTGIAENDMAGCAIDTRGQVFCFSQWGSHLRGTGLANPPKVPVPVQGVTGAVDVALGDRHGCAVLATGQVVCWGSNDDDALGGGEPPVSLVPLEVPLGGAPAR